MAPGAEKTVAGKQVVLVGRPALRFCNRHQYQAPISSQSGGGGSEGRKGMLFHTPHKGREWREMWALFFHLFLLLSIRATADSGQGSGVGKSRLAGSG